MLVLEAVNTAPLLLILPFCPRASPTAPLLPERSQVTPLLSYDKCPKEGSCGGLCLPPNAAHRRERPSGKRVCCLNSSDPSPQYGLYVDGNKPPLPLFSGTSQGNTWQEGIVLKRDNNKQGFKAGDKLLLGFICSSESDVAYTRKMAPSLSHLYTSVGFRAIIRVY